MALMPRQDEAGLEIHASLVVERMKEDPCYLPSKELIAEKFNDNINYTLLFEGLVEDRRELITGSRVFAAMG